MQADSHEVKPDDLAGCLKGAVDPCAEEFHVSQGTRKGTLVIR